jgi:hypothetical protein
VTEHPVAVHSDSKPLSCLRRCNLTSKRVTRWIIQLQAYGLNTVRISNANSFFADVLSRTPRRIDHRKPRPSNKQHGNFRRYYKLECVEIPEEGIRKSPEVAI